MQKIIIVAGALANKPMNGGAAWTRISWLLGLRRLGFETYFLEEIQPEHCVDETGQIVEFGESHQPIFLAQRGSFVFQFRVHALDRSSSGK